MTDEVVRDLTAVQLGTQLSELRHQTSPPTGLGFDDGLAGRADGFI